MHPSRHLCRRRLLAILTIAALLVQSQSLFACDMMGISGSIHHCCCDDIPMDSAQGSGTSECCNFTEEITLASSDIDGDKKPLLVPSKSGVDPPNWWTFTDHHWPTVAVAPNHALTKAYHTVSSLPGTRTYLATLRLRI